jgi:hypothetical protein
MAEGAVKCEGGVRSLYNFFFLFFLSFFYLFVKHNRVDDYNLIIVPYNLKEYPNLKLFISDAKSEENNYLILLFFPWGGGVGGGGGGGGVVDCYRGMGG